MRQQPQNERLRSPGVPSTGWMRLPSSHHKRMRPSLFLPPFDWTSNLKRSLVPQREWSWHLETLSLSPSQAHGTRGIPVLGLLLLAVPSMLTLFWHHLAYSLPNGPPPWILAKFLVATMSSIGLLLYLVFNCIVALIMLYCKYLFRSVFLWLEHKLIEGREHVLIAYLFFNWNKLFSFRFTEKLQK